MKRLLILTAMLFSLLLVSCQEGKDEWNAICPVLAGIELTCEGVKRPNIEYFSEEDEEADLRGYYLGGDTIFIRDDLSKKLTSSVIVHEIIHYLQVQNGFLTLPGLSRQVCAAEAQAFQITDIYRETIGLAKVGDRWWKNYYYCWQYYAPIGAQMIIMKLPDGEILIDLIE